VKNLSKMKMVTCTGAVMAVATAATAEASAAAAVAAAAASNQWVLLIYYKPVVFKCCDLWPQQIMSASGHE